MCKISQMMVALTIAGLCCTTAYTEENPEPQNSLDLSEGTLALLQAEMRELAAASQTLVMPFVTGDWKSVQRISEKIRVSYVMEQNLTDAQKQELADKLPERFKRLDRQFHTRAARLESAAADRNPELIAFHYYRLLETCATCHSEYAASRFPGFATSTKDIHRH